MQSIMNGLMDYSHTSTQLFDRKEQMKQLRNNINNDSIVFKDKALTRMQMDKPVINQVKEFKELH